MSLLSYGWILDQKALSPGLKTTEKLWNNNTKSCIFKPPTAAWTKRNKSVDQKYIVVVNCRWSHKIFSKQPMVITNTKWPCYRTMFWIESQKLDQRAYYNKARVFKKQTSRTITFWPYDTSHLLFDFCSKMEVLFR